VALDELRDGIAEVIVLGLKDATAHGAVLSGLLLGIPSRVSTAGLKCNTEW
jgi:hypothetical protein